jgi:hypothetical protein
MIRSLARLVCAFAAVAALLALAQPADAFWHHRRVVAGYPVAVSYTPVVAAYAPAPVVTAGYAPTVGCCGAAPVTASYAPVTAAYAPAPVTAYYAPSVAPATYAAPVTSYYAPAPTTTYYAPASVNAYYSPAPFNMVVPRTVVGRPVYVYP